MNTCTPCPFCGSVPVFEGEPEDRSDRRYFIYYLPCGCHSIEVCAGSWGYYKEGSPNDWPVRAAAGATENWNKSFTVD